MHRLIFFFKQERSFSIGGFSKNIFKLENLFVFFVLIYGALFAVFVPPNQVPDEFGHIARVYGTLDGNLTSRNIHLPDQLRPLLMKYFRAGLQKTNIRVADYFNDFSIRSAGKAIEGDAAAPYSPILYLPQLAGVSIGMMLRLSDLTTLILGRIFSLLVYVALGYAILKKAPLARRSLFVLLTMPMSVFLAASYSADTIQNLLSFLYINMIIVGLSSTSKLSRKELIMLLGISILLSLSKPVSLLVILLSLAIPVTRFENRQRKTIFILSQLGLGLIFTFLWSRLSSTSEIPVTYAYDYIRPKVQLMYIFLNPISYIKMIFATLNQFLEEWYYGFVGKFAWLTISMPNFVYFLFPVALLFAMLIDRKQPPIMEKEQRYIFGGVFSLYVIGVITSMYVIWSPVGNPIAIGVQGRYFISVIPILPYLFLSFNRQGKLSWEWAAHLGMVFLVLAMLFFAFQTIYLNYYVPCGKYFYDITGTCKLPVDLPGEIPIGEITKPVTQTFTAECDNIIGVDVLFATYARLNRGFLTVSLRDKTSNTLVFKEKINVENLHNNEWKSFTFPTVPNTYSNQFALTLSPQGSAPGNAVTVWATASDIYTEGELSGTQSKGDLLFRYVCRYGIVHGIRDFYNK